MPNAPQTPETFGQNPNPVQLLDDLEALDTDQKKFNHLRGLFLEKADVDEYMQYLDTDENIDLTRKQLTSLKVALKGYNVYLKEYLEQTSGRIGRFDEKLKKGTEEFANPELTPEAVRKISHTRERVAKAMQIAMTPRGTKGKSLREATQGGVPSKEEKVLEPEAAEALLDTLKARFEANMQRHKGLEWSKVQARLEASPEKMWSLNEMERTGGEPDVVGYDKKTNEYIFNDCSAESPEGRRMVCYDLDGQKLAEADGYKPAGNAIDAAKAMGIAVLTEAEYGELQKLGNFDRSTWSWLQTPADIRKSGDALYGYRNYGGVDVYQADARKHDDIWAFRGSLRV